MSSSRAIRILVADDDADDRMLIGDAFDEARLSTPMSYVEDGIELLDFLRGEGKYVDHNGSDHLPDLILLDLNMPRMDGRAALKEIRKDEVLRKIPIVVLTTSKSEEDVLRTYDLGVNSFITKPVTFDGLVEVVQVLNKYWIEIVALPSVE